MQQNAADVFAAAAALATGASPAIALPHSSPWANGVVGISEAGAQQFAAEIAAGWRVAAWRAAARWSANEFATLRSGWPAGREVRLRGLGA